MMTVTSGRGRLRRRATRRASGAARGPAFTIGSRYCPGAVVLGPGNPRMTQVLDTMTVGTATSGGDSWAGLRYHGPKADAEWRRGFHATRTERVAHGGRGGGRARDRRVHLPALAREGRLPLRRHHRQGRRPAQGEPLPARPVPA